MPYTFADRVWFNTTTLGTGTLTVGTPLISYQVPATAGIPSGSAVNYTIVDGVGWEVGKGVLTSGTPWTLSRDTVEASSAGGAKLSLSGNASCFLTVTAAMLAGQPISVIAFGAKDDGVHDDTGAINDAIAAAGVVYIPGGGRQFLVSGTLTLPSNGAIIGTEGKATIVTAAANFPLIRITGLDTTVKNLKIFNANKTGGADILIDVGPTTPLQRIIIEDVEATSSWGCIADTGSGTNFYVSTFVRRVRSLSCRGADAFRLTRIFGYLVMEDCYADFISVSSPLSDFNGFAIDNALIGGAGANPPGRAFLTRCFSVGNYSGTTITGNNAFHFNNTGEVWLTDCRADSVGGYGFVFANVNQVHIDNCGCTLVNGPGWTFDTVLYLEASNLRVYGRNAGGIPGAANAPGISLLTNCGIMSFVNPVIYGVFGDGINIPGQIGPINITGGRVIGCTGWGIETSGSYALLGVGLQLSTNSAGNYNILGPIHYLRDTQINSGAVVDVGPGPVSG